MVAIKGVQVSFFNGCSYRVYRRLVSIIFKQEINNNNYNYSDCRDTVSSLGAIRGRSLPVTTASTNVRTFRHALSLDERRARFQPHFWKEKQIENVNHFDTKDYTKTEKQSVDVEEVWFAVCLFISRSSPSYLFYH